MKPTHTQQAVIIAALFSIANGLLYLAPIYRLVGATTVLSIGSLTNIAAALIGVWMGVRLWQSARRGESLWLIWGSLTTGLILWIVAEITWDVYQLSRGIEMPSASPSDIAWGLGYLAVIAGLILRIQTFRMRPTKAWQFAVLAAFGILAILAVIYIVIPSLNTTPGGPSYEKLSGLFYAACDLVLAFLAILLVLVLDGGLLSKPWTAIAVACFCIALSNLLYVYALAHDIFQVNPAAGLDSLNYLIAIFYTFAYILMALGLYLQASLQDAI